MVIILIGVAGSGKDRVGRALAAELGWRFEDAQIPRDETSRDRRVTELHHTVARAMDRRESLVVACTFLEPPQRDVLRGELRHVRFVLLVANSRYEPSFPEIAIDATQPVGAIVAAIRKEIGI